MRMGGGEEKREKDQKMGATVTRFYKLIKLFKDCFLMLFINYSVDLNYLKIK